MRKMRLPTRWLSCKSSSEVSPISLRSLGYLEVSPVMAWTVRLARDSDATVVCQQNCVCETGREWKCIHLLRNSFGFLAVIAPVLLQFQRCTGRDAPVRVADHAERQGGRQPRFYA